MNSGIFVKVLSGSTLLEPIIRYGVTVDPQELTIEPDPSYRDDAVDPWQFSNECVWATWAPTMSEAIELFQSLEDNDYVIPPREAGRVISWYNARICTITAYDEDGYPIGIIKDEGIRPDLMRFGGILSRLSLPEED